MWHQSAEAADTREWRLPVRGLGGAPRVTDRPCQRIGTFGTVRVDASAGRSFRGICMRRVAVFLILLAAASVGCTRERAVRTVPFITPTAAATQTVEVAPLPDGWTRCVNEPEGWSIGYPDDWFTTYLYTDPLTGENERRAGTACMFFDPNKFTIPRDGEYPETALQVGLTDSPIERALAYLTDPTYWRTLAREESLVLGMPAVRLEVEALGYGLELKGTLRYGWIVDLGRRSFSVFAVAQPDKGRDRYLAYGEVAERAIRTVQFASATPG